jgi:hypothetical protein
VHSLPIAHIYDGVFQTRFVAKVTLTSALCPPLLPNDTTPFGGLTASSFLQFLESSGAPSLELLAYFIWTAVSSYDDVHVIGSTAHRVQFPTSDATVVRNRRFDQASLLLVKYTRVLGHPGLGFQLPNWIGKLRSLSMPDPSTFIAWQPRSIGGPRQKVRQWLGHRRLMRPGTLRAESSHD